MLTDEIPTTLTTLLLAVSPALANETYKGGLF